MSLGGMVRRATPLLLLALALLAWFGDALPGHDAIARRFGSTAVLRFVVGIVCVLLVIHTLDQRRLEALFKRVVEEFKKFHVDKRGEESGARGDAIRILISALGSDDPNVRGKAATHLRRVTGQDFGEDAARWQEWADRELGAP